MQLEVVNFKKNSYLFLERKTNSSHFYIIQSGKVQRVSFSTRNSDSVSILREGDLVGVIGCMSGHNEIANVVALTDVVAISVKRDDYSEFIAKNSTVAMKIIGIFAKEVRRLNEMLTQLMLKNTLISSPEEMYSIAVYYEKIKKTDLAVYGYYQYMKECPRGEFAKKAKDRFIVLKPHSRAVYLKPAVETIRKYPKDTMIFSECQSGQDMFIIQSGQVKISKVVDDNEVTLDVLHKGDFFGEMSLLENKPRSASAIAHESCILSVVNLSNFNQMVATQPQLIARLTITLAVRLWVMSRHIINARLRDPMYKLFDMLALQLEKRGVTSEQGQSYYLDITPYDLANMCGIPQEEQEILVKQFIKNPRIRLNENKIFITDCQGLIKSAEFYRKQNFAKENVIQEQEST